jgi:hypothetical protein
LSDAAVGEHAHQRCGHAKVGKILVGRHVSVPFRHRCALSSRGVAPDEHKVARLPVGKIDRRETLCGSTAQMNESSTTWLAAVS